VYHDIFSKWLKSKKTSCYPINRVHHLTIAIAIKYYTGLESQSDMLVTLWVSSVLYGWIHYMRFIWEKKSITWCVYL